MTKSVEQSAAGGVASFWSQMEALVELFKGRRLTEVFRHVSFVPHEPYGPHAHRRIEINYVRRGSCFMECGGQTQGFRQGELMIVTPQAPHRFEAGPRGAVLMQLEFLPEVFLALGFRPDGVAGLSHPRVVKMAGDVEISGTVRRIIAELQRRRPDSIHLVVLLYAELLLLLRRHLADSMSAAGAPAALRVATDFVRQNYGAPLAVADVARRAGVSERYLRSLFASYLHVSPIDFVRRVRVAKAVELIQTTELSVKEISYRCGFSSPQYFARTFRQVYGASPCSLARPAAGDRGSAGAARAAEQGGAAGA